MKSQLPEKRIFLSRTAIILSCFLVHKYSRYAYGYLIFGKENWNALPVMFRSLLLLLTGILMALLALYLIRRKVTLEHFGLSWPGFGKGALASSIFVIPMIASLVLLPGSRFQPDGEILFRGLVLAGFGEEFIFRAFLFGLLFFQAGWGFLSAGIFTGLFFGAGHLYQAHDWVSGLSIFLFTTGVSLGFAWFYYAWKSLWMVIFLHGWMDVIWDSFGVETDVTGSIWVNVGRFCTLAFAIVYSIREARKNNRMDLKNKLWFNPQGW